MMSSVAAPIFCKNDQDVYSVANKMIDAAWADIHQWENFKKSSKDLSENLLNKNHVSFINYENILINIILTLRNENEELTWLLSLVQIKNDNFALLQEDVADKISKIFVGDKSKSKINDASSIPLRLYCKII